MIFVSDQRNYHQVKFDPARIRKLDNLCRLIEEIFSTRFLKETIILKASISKGETTTREGVQYQRNISFPYFINEFIKEKTKNAKNLGQVIFEKNEVR